MPREGEDAAVAAGMCRGWEGRCAEPGHALSLRCTACPAADMQETWYVYGMSLNSLGQIEEVCTTPRGQSTALRVRDCCCLQSAQRCSFIFLGMRDTGDQGVQEGSEDRPRELRGVAAAWLGAPPAPCEVVLGADGVYCMRIASRLYARLGRHTRTSARSASPATTSPRHAMPMLTGALVLGSSSLQRPCPGRTVASINSSYGRALGEFLLYGSVYSSCAPVSHAEALS
jgi:hypothetical protein